MKVDLHLHTSASDGTWLPEDLIRNVIDSGIEIFSVTDHDSVENVEAVSGLAVEESLTFFKGVEINTFKKGQIFHILGYNIDTNNETLNNTLLQNRSFLEERNEESISVLSENGHPVSRDEYSVYQNDPGRGGWKAFSKDGKKPIAEGHPREDKFLVHANDFMDSMASRKAPIADISTGHISAAVAILGNVAFLAQEKIRYDPKTDRLDKSQKDHLLTRSYREKWSLPTV